MWTPLSAPAAPKSVVLSGPSAPTVLVIGDGHRAAHLSMVLASSDLLMLRTARPAEDGSGSLPDVVLVVMDQAAGLNRALLEARAIAGTAKLVVLSEVEDPGVLMTAVRAGVDGWILPGTAAADSVDRLVRVARGEAGFCQVVLGLLVVALRSTPASVPVSPPEIAEPDTLTARERQVHDAVQAGQTVREIAQRLSLSEVTVRWHAGRASKKLQRPSAPVVPDLAVPGPASVVPHLAAVLAGPVVVRAARSLTLSPAESRVARLVAQGLSNPQVAERLSISRHTVESHLKQVFGKLGVTSRVQLTRMLLKEEGRAG